jgi:integrase
MPRGRVYNRIYDEDEWQLINPLNKELMDDYKAELKQNQKSKGTIYQYYSDWRIIMTYIYRKLQNKYILELTKRDFRRFSLWLTDELKVSNARHNRLMSALRSLLTYCEEDDEIEYDNNAARKVKGLKKDPVRDIIFISNEQVMKLKGELIRREDYAKATLLMLVYDSAGRKNELFQVEKECFYDKNRNYTNTVVGKRGKKFPLLYFDATKECAELYLKQRGEDDLKEMWITGKDENKSPITVGTIYDWFIAMNNILEKLENRKIGFNVHSFRHSALENYSTGEHYMCKKLGKEDGFLLEDLQLVAHHDSSDITSSYLKDKSDERLQEMFGIKINE